MEVARLDSKTTTQIKENVDKLDGELKEFKQEYADFEIKMDRMKSYLLNQIAKKQSTEDTKKKDKTRHKQKQEMSDSNEDAMSDDSYLAKPKATKNISKSPSVRGLNSADQRVKQSAFQSLNQTTSGEVQSPDQDNTPPPEEKEEQAASDIPEIKAESNNNSEHEEESVSSSKESNVNSHDSPDEFDVLNAKMASAHAKISRMVTRLSKIEMELFDEVVEEDEEEEGATGDKKGGPQLESQDTQLKVNDSAQQS